MTTKKDTPLIDPVDNPEYFLNQMKTIKEELKDEVSHVIREELKPMGRFMTITTNNQTVIYVGSVIRFILFTALFIMANNCSPN